MSSPIATGLAITNPLVKYRALLATKAIAPDNGQLRLALHLQKVYDRLKDYEPEVEYSRRLDQISRAVKPRNASPNDSGNGDAVTEQPPRTARQYGWRSPFGRTAKKESLALTRKLTSHESALELDTPKGLMLHGEVGTGKSMLIDLFADCLPNRKKRRWHFNTFMLETFAKLESYRQDRSNVVNAATTFSQGAEEDNYSLLWLAKDLVQTSPIVFLDEFQMPDRAASKILTNLMTSFFHLGGVLVATSNRMPEELAKASGIDLAPPPSRLESLGWQFGFRRKVGGSSGRNEFARFLEVLKARCEVWEMEGGRDWRRVESSKAAPVRLVDVVEELNDWQLDGQDDLVAMTEGALEEEAVQDAEMPKYYHLGSLEEPEHRKAYESALIQATGQQSSSTIAFAPSSMRVYGRTIIIPQTHTNTVTQWTFTELCKSTLGPADYITLASTYQTLILLDVPVLTSLMKNEARRFITLLDALYECRCKLFITAEAGPDELFFPETKGKDAESEADAIQSETFAEAYQDATAPFRPNILTDNPNYAEPDPEPDYTHARLAGLLNARLNADALEDDPPTQARKGSSNPFARSFGRSDAELMKRERAPVDPDEPRFIGRGAPDFGKTSAFTGEDERFAYKRARSRLWELCGARWWARSEEDWHRPLPIEVRKWEVSAAERAAAAAASHFQEPGSDGPTSDVQLGGSVEDETRDERSFKSPFRTERGSPPKLSSAHVWSLGQWGPRAGAWGEGVEGLKGRGKEGK